MSNFENSSSNTPPTSDSTKRSLRLTAAAIAENQRRKAKISLIDFVLATQPAYKAGWFHRQLAAELDLFVAHVEAHRGGLLIIQAPPQHGKSELASRYFPAYAIGRNPDLAIIATAYAADLAQRFSRDVRRITEATEYRQIFPDTRITARFDGTTDTVRTVEFWEVAGGRGSYRACGIGGGV